MMIRNPSVILLIIIYRSEPAIKAATIYTTSIIQAWGSSMLMNTIAEFLLGVCEPM